jgi:hypothetical protein
MELTKIYYKFSKDRILGISTEQKTEEYSNCIEAENFDNAILKFSEKEYVLSDEQREELEEIFMDDESTAEYANEDLSEGFKIKHWVSNRSFGELIDMYENKEIKIPEMQREFVWNSSKSSRLIESIVLGLPIPPLFLLEVNDNEYEIIDGYQRLTTVFNFVQGNPWGGKKEKGRNIASKLSSKNILNEIAGKKFNDLDEKYQRKIRRSTIPLMEFKQLTPGDFSSKYLIFERINTGSDKLNAMQIRKSLAYGEFMINLYKYANSDENYLNLFTVSQIKKDIHVEALLRFLAITDLVYGKIQIKRKGIKNILDEYCELCRNTNISEERIKNFFKILNKLLQIFDGQNIFRRVNSDGEYEGVLNIGILEALLGTIIEEDILVKEDIENQYKTVMRRIYDDAILDKEPNPFSANTGTEEMIKKRYEITKEILGV